MIETKEFTIKVKMQERWVPHFLSMLAHMERLGDLGASAVVRFNVDGDGGFRANFEPDIEWEQIERWNQTGERVS